MAKLTDGRGGTIAKATPPEKGQRFMFDEHRDAPRGFALRITAAGGKAFVLRYRVGGRQRRMTIGAWPTWSLEAARKQASEYKQQIDAGKDVLDERRQEKTDPTVREAVGRYCTQKVDALTSGKSTRRYFERDVLPVLGNRKLKAVSRADVIALVERKAADTPRAASLLLTHLKSFFAWAVDRELLENSPAAVIRPANISKNMKARKRKRVLTDEEIKSLWGGVEEADLHRLTGLCLKLILVTGQRPGEVAGMAWEEIKGDTWIIPASRRLKTETDHSVPLTETAKELIEQAREEVERLQSRRKWEGGAHVFEESSRGGMSVEGLSRAVKLKAAQLGNQVDPTWGNWTPHDLRRTARTGLSAAGVSQEVAERVVGHTGSSMVETYNQHAYETEKRAALEAWERRLLRIIGQGQPDNNVVSIGAR